LLGACPRISRLNLWKKAILTKKWTWGA